MFFFCFFFVVFSFMSHVCVLSLIFLFIISGEFDALHQLSVKKNPLEIQHPKLETADSVLMSLFMRDNGRCDILHAA